MTFEDFYEKHHKGVQRACLSKLCAGEAEDAAQDVWVKVFRAWESATPTKTWLNKVIQNVVIDAYRKRKGEVELEPHHAFARDVTDTVATNLALEQACAVLNALEPARRFFFVRHITAERGEPGRAVGGVERARINRIREKVRVACAV